MSTILLAFHMFVLILSSRSALCFRIDVFWVSANWDFGAVLIYIDKGHDVCMVDRPR